MQERRRKHAGIAHAGTPAVPCGGHVRRCGDAGRPEPAGSSAGFRPGDRPARPVPGTAEIRGTAF